MTNHPSPPKNAWPIWILLLVSLLVVLACAAYPLYVIWPFRRQEPGQLAIALRILEWRPWVSILCVLAALFAFVMFLRMRIRWMWLVLAGAGCVVVVALAIVCRINVYERMFHPLDKPAFARASETKLAGDEEVIAVRVNGQARAYPVRIISYHHIVNDRLGGVPLVATY